MQEGKGRQEEVVREQYRVELRSGPWKMSQEGVGWDIQKEGGVECEKNGEDRQQKYREIKEKSREVEGHEKNREWNKGIRHASWKLTHL